MHACDVFEILQDFSLMPHLLEKRSQMIQELGSTPLVDPSRDCVRFGCFSAGELLHGPDGFGEGGGSGSLISGISDPAVALISPSVLVSLITHLYSVLITSPADLASDFPSLLKGAQSSRYSFRCDILTHNSK
nr:unnamed protein product [Spirometra erinaceieuropaei]